MGLDTGDIAAWIIAASGAVATIYATRQSSKAAKRSQSAEEKAQAFQAADAMIHNLQADNDDLRTQLGAQRREYREQYQEMARETQRIDERARKREQELDRRWAEEHRRCQDQLRRVTSDFIGLRALVVDEVAKEAAKDALDALDPEVVEAARQIDIDQQHNPNPPEVDQ